MSRVAIIGSGIAGLTTAWHLRRDHEVVIYEANDYLGGHTATKDVQVGDRWYAVDTGFIVFNDWTYPNFIALLTELGVEWQWSNMSFSLRCERSGLEYNGTSINSLFAQRRNIVNLKFLQMIADILRFNRDCRSLLRDDTHAETLGHYLQRGRYSRAFIEQYIVPMGRAIWSATGSGMLNFPARFFVDFFDRHGFLNIDDRPVWRTVRGGSREYVKQMARIFDEDRRVISRVGTPVKQVCRHVDRVDIIDARGALDRFDYVVMACHSDQALAMLESPTHAERDVLGAFPYQPNEAILHTDARVLPRKPLARAAWNYHLRNPDTERVCLTYDMNVLQNIESSTRFLVTLNRDDIDPAQILGRYVYDHPVYTPQAVRAQARRAEVSGHQRSFYCGAYWRYGFHEDGVVSALWALDDFYKIAGGQRPPQPVLEPQRRPPPA